MNVSRIIIDGADASDKQYVTINTRIVLKELLSNESYRICVAASRNSSNLRGDFTTPIIVLPCKFAILLTFPVAVDKLVESGTGIAIETYCLALLADYLL